MGLQGAPGASRAFGGLRGGPGTSRARLRCVWRGWRGFLKGSERPEAGCLGELDPVGKLYGSMVEPQLLVGTLDLPVLMGSSCFRMRVFVELIAQAGVCAAVGVEAQYRHVAQTR